MKNKMLITSRVFLLIVFILSFGFSVSYGQTKESLVDIEPSKTGGYAENLQLSYEPADGSTAKVNPPPFIWVPAKISCTYRLEISRDKDFRADVITKKGIDISTYALGRTLEPGQWFWRYGVEGDEVVYSKARKFTIPADVRKCPFPNIKKVINSVPRSRPRLFILKDEIQSYRHRAKSGDLKEFCSNVVKACEEHIGEKLIEEPPLKSFGSYDYFAIVPPPIDLMEKFALAYILTGEKKYGEEAKRRLLHFCGWDPNGSTSNRRNDEAAMWIIMRGLRAYDFTYELFGPDEREKVEKVMKIRAKQFYDRLKYRAGREYHSYNYGSHEGRILGFIGQAALCFAHEWNEAQDWLEYVLTLYWNMWPAWGKEDGGWHQGPSYWGLYVGFTLQFVVELEKATGIDLMERPFFHNTPYFKFYTNPAYAKMSPFADGEHHPPRAGGEASTYDKSGEVMYQFSTLLNDPYLRWYADYLGAGGGEYAIGAVLKNDKIKGKPPLELPQSRYFPGAGLVSVHTDFGNPKKDIHFLFRCDPYGNISHAHPDQNAYTIEAFGEALAIASGYYPWYASGHHKNWSWQTKSSNSITIDGGIGQKRTLGTEGKVVFFESGDSRDYIIGDATAAYSGLLKKFHRYITHIRPGIFVMFDDLEAPKPVTFEWWLHSLSEMSIDSAQKSITISQGDARLKVVFLQRGQLDFEQFKGFPDPPEVNKNPMNVVMGKIEPDQWHVTVSTRPKSTAARFVTVLLPFKKGEEPEVSDGRVTEKAGWISIELKINGKKHSVGYYLF
ncbi:MAG: DUF4962 domain-containing protein [Planctomycetota bacterium]|jgi:hypothetical protein